MEREARWATAGQVAAYAVLICILLLIFELVFYVSGLVLQSRWAMWQVPEAPVGVRAPLTYDESIR